VPEAVPGPAGIPQTECRVLVLDTGMADPAFRPTWVDMVDDGGEFDEPDTNDDGYVDPVAGHGTFIAWIIRRLAPTATVSVRKVLTTFGTGDDARIAKVLSAFADLAPAQRPHIVSLSFSGTSQNDEPFLALKRAVRKLRRAHMVVVASAGNEASCRVVWPAALTGVISVGALDRDQPAFFTNYGPWVRACAPGVGVTSAFFKWDGSTVPNPPPDPEYFDGWAAWSGTSFSAPIVAASLARAMTTWGITARQAVRRVIDDPDLFRLSMLGTVVNSY